MKLDLTAVVLTLNEERHLTRCLESLRNLAQRWLWWIASQLIEREKLR